MAGTPWTFSHVSLTETNLREMREARAELSARFMVCTNPFEATRSCREMGTVFLAHASLSAQSRRPKIYAISRNLAAERPYNRPYNTKSPLPGQ